MTGYPPGVDVPKVGGIPVQGQVTLEPPAVGSPIMGSATGLQNIASTGSPLTPVAGPGNNPTGMNP